MQWRLTRLGEALLRRARGMRRHAKVRGPVLEAAGGHDLTQAAQVQDLHERCRQRLRSGAGRLRVDLTEVTRVDTKLVASLVALRRAALRSGQGFEVECSEPVRNWLRVCRLEALVRPVE